MPWSSPASPQLPRWLLLHRDVLLKKKKRRKVKQPLKARSCVCDLPSPGVRPYPEVPQPPTPVMGCGGGDARLHTPVLPKSVRTVWGGSLSDLGQQDICSILKVFFKWKQRPLFVSLLHQQLLNSSLIYEPGCYECLHLMLLAQVDVLRVITHFRSFPVLWVDRENASGRCWWEHVWALLSWRGEKGREILPWHCCRKVSVFPQCVKDHGFQTISYCVHTERQIGTSSTVYFAHATDLTTYLHLSSSSPKPSNPKLGKTGPARFHHPE